MTNIIFDLFVNNWSAKSIWETLIKKYGADDAGMKKYVAGNWLNFKMDDDKPIMEQVHVYKNLTAEVLAEGMHMCEVLQANVLIERLPEAWSDYRNRLKHKKRDLTLEELIGHMKIEEANRQKDKNLNFMLPSIKANLVEPSVNYNDRSKFTKKKSTWQKKTPPFKKPATQFKTNAGCFVCGKQGHRAFQCYLRKKPQGGHSKEGKNQAHLTEDTKEPTIFAAVVSEINLVDNRVDWIVDSGASKHFCSNKSLFSEFEATEGEQVYMGNSSTAGVFGKGKIQKIVMEMFKICS
ncbi:Retrovirus-related Pol polyprotein from transposon TNT 1-94 [Linum perenne]